MIKSKFFRLFTSLSEKEQEKFFQFVLLMYGEQKKSTLLLQYIVPYKKQKDQEQYLSRAKAHLFVFEKEMVGKKEEKNIYNALSDLTNWLENFFICESKDTSSFVKDLLVANLYKERRLPQNHQHKLNYTKRKVDRTDEYYWSKLKYFLVNELNYFDTEKDPHQLDGTILIEADKYLESFYLLTKLRYACELLNRNYLKEETNEKLLNTQVIHLIKKYPSNIEIELLYSLSNLLSTKSQAAYLAFKKLLTTKEIKDKQLFRVFIIYAASFTASKIRENEKYYVAESLQLYQLGLSRNALLINGLFPEFPFKNIVNLYCFQKDIKEAKKFIEKWKKFLPKNKEGDIAELCRSRVLFDEKKYSEAKRILNSQSFNNPYYDVEARVLNIRIAYEMGQSEIATQSCLTLENFLRRNKNLSQSFRESSLNFSKITRKIINHVDKKKVLKTIEKVKFIICLPWIKEKIK